MGCCVALLLYYCNCHLIYYYYEKLALPQITPYLRQPTGKDELNSEQSQETLIGSSQKGKRTGVCCPFKSIEPTISRWSTLH